jgi:dihydrodipicolinate synthase/N-acetylneuraminate lyase
MSSPITIPALTFRQPGGSVDLSMTRRYAGRASATPVRYFLVSGTTGRGNQATVGERAQLLETWRLAAGPDRVLACCWEPDDLRAASDMGVRAMLVIQRQDSFDQLLTTLRAAPDGYWLYSHPRYSAPTIDPHAAAVRAADKPPRGAKVSKVSLDTVAKLRNAAGSYVGLWHGSSRNIVARAVAANVHRVLTCSGDCVHTRS